MQAAVARITSRCDLSEAQKRNLELLKDSKTEIVVSGQQVGLFGGPLLTLYKALGCSMYAEQIAKAKNVQCVPIFWLQTEDHDYAEVSKLHYIGAGGVERSVELDDQSENSSKVSMHYRVLGPKIQDLLLQLSDSLKANTAAEWLITLLSECYKPGESWELAFQRYLHSLLKDTGILFFHPRDHEIAELCTPIYERAISKHSEITDLLKQTIQRDGIDEQVHIRAGSPLAFFHIESESSERVRLQADGDNFTFVGTAGSIPKEEALQLVNSQPLRFSASALLRPIIQQKLLSPVCYVAGAAEVAYFKQIVELFDYFGVSKPQVLVRPAARLFDRKFLQWMKEYEVTPQHLKLSEREFEGLLAAKSGIIAPDEVKMKIETQIDQLFSLIERDYLRVDATLKGAIDRVRSKIAPGFTVLHEKLIKALAVRDHVRSERLQRIRASVFPHGLEQERYFSGLNALAREGSSLISKLQNGLKLNSVEPATIELE